MPETIRLGCQENKAPGETPEARCGFLADVGFGSVEIWGRDLAGKPNGVQEWRRVLDATGMALSVVLVGYGGCLIDADPSLRERARSEIAELLRIAGDLGAEGLIVVPGFFIQNRVPDLSPVGAARELEDRLAVESLRLLAPVAEAAGTRLILEPLNRGETHYLRTLDHAARLIQKAGVPGLALMADTFHMNIEETDPFGAVERHIANLAHVHLADNTRLEPGSGQFDFEGLFESLRRAGYQGWASLECGFTSAPETCLRSAYGRLSQV